MATKSPATAARAAKASFRDIPAWQSTMQLAADTYRLTADLPIIERPGLGVSLQQAAVQVPTLLAAGAKTGSRVALRAACLRALEALGELETLLYITGQLYPDAASGDLLDQLSDADRQIQTLIARLDKQNNPAAPRRKPAVL